MDKKNVFVVANENSKNSLELANFYIKARSLPKENLIIINCPNTEEISWNDFSENIFNPLRELFVKNEKIIASISPNKDEKNRLILESCFANNIDCIVLCFLPLKIADSKNAPKQKPIDASSVDSELTLLPKAGELKTEMFLKNPAFTKESPTLLDKVNFVKLARIDAPSLALAKHNINNCIFTETYGLMGNAYIDLSKKYKSGDIWLKRVYEIAKKMGYPTYLDEDPKIYPMTKRFDSPAIYFGWYISNPNIAFSYFPISFASGAIAYHIYSFSGESLYKKHIWANFFTSKNVSSCFAYVNEPYLPLTTRPDIFFDMLSKNYFAIEAYYAATPVFSWQGVYFGDPLYKPFEISLNEQLKNIKKSIVFENSQYAVLRKINILKYENPSLTKENEIKILEEYLPYLKEKTALLYELIKLKESLNLDYKIHIKEILKTNQNDKDTKNALNANLKGLYIEIAQYLFDKKQEKYALLFITSVLNVKMHRSFAIKALPIGIKIANTCDENQARIWQEKLNLINQEIEKEKLAALEKKKLQEAKSLKNK